LESFFQMVNVQAVLFVYLAVGVFCRKKNIISDQSTQSFVNFLINVTLPCMVFHSFSVDLTLSQLASAGAVLAAATAICAFSYLLSKLLYRRCPADERAIMSYGTLVNNCGFAGLPMIASTFSAEVTFFASIYIIPTRIAMWSAGISMFTQTPLREKIRKVMLNPGIVSCELGILRMLLSIDLPPVLNTAIYNIGECTVPMSMIVVGAILAESGWRGVFEKNVLYLTAVRLVMIPLLVLAALRLIGFDAELLPSIVLLVAMPVGVTTAILAQRYGANTTFASKCVLVSTMLSFLTVPLLTLLL